MRIKIAGFLFICWMLLLFTSCKKESAATADSGYYMKFKRNGEWVNFTVFQSDLNPKNEWYINGQTVGDTERISITVLTHSKDFGVGTYCTDDKSIQLFVNYEIDPNSANPYNTWGVEDMNGKPPCKHTVTITSLSDSVVCGKFTGNYLRNLCVNTMDLTEGEFRAKLNR